MYTKNQILLSQKKTSYGVMLLLVFLSAFGGDNFHSVSAQAAIRESNVAQVTESHQITYFLNNKPAAVSFTFDDGYISQATNGVSELNARGLKGTFFVMTDPEWVNSHALWSAWQSVVAQGHEVASQTVTHPSLSESDPPLSEAEIRWELSESQAAIDQYVPNQSCASLAYPYTESDSTVQAIVADYYNAARGGWADEGIFLNHYESGQDQYGSWTPLNFYNIGSMSGDNITTSDVYLNGNLDRALSRNAWFDLHFHQINNAAWFGNLLDYVMGKGDYWIDTFCNISRYMKERLNSTVQVISESTYQIRLSIVMDESLSTDVYNFPLTIRSVVPTTWTDVVVEQEGDVQDVTPVMEGNEKVVYYNAIPNGGDVFLKTPYPAPGITSLSPTSALAGGASFTLTVNGTNFFDSSVVRWNGSSRTTNYVSSTQLTAVISASDIASNGTANVTVFTPSPGGGNTSELSFNILLPNPPAAFNKSAPTNGAINQANGVTLTWGTSSGATSYEYCYDTTNNNTCSPWASNGTATTKTLNGLTSGSTYYWHIRAVNSEGTTYSNGSSSAFSSFTLSCYTLTKGLNPGTGGTINASPAPNCNSGTQYSYGTIVTLNVVPNVGYTFSNWSGDLSGSLHPNNIAMTANRSVGATLAIFNNNPSGPVLRSPQSNLYTKLNLLTFLWNKSTGAQSYEIMFAKDAAFTNNVVSTFVNGLSYTVTSAFTDGQYYWRVRAYDANNQFGKWSSTRSFTVDTTGPSAPILSSPTNNTSTRTPTFKWLNVPTAVIYEFQYDNNSNFSSPTYTVTGRGTSRKPPAMKVGTYYWKVRAQDSVGNWGSWSAPFTVTITGP